MGRYQLAARLATGGMAEVYLARQVGPAGFEKLVVIKRLLPHVAEDRSIVEMFLDEARIVARLSHPNIVQVFDLGTEGESYFIAMEYLQGQPLRKLEFAALERKAVVPFDVSAAVVYHVAGALHYAHEFRDLDGSHLGIVHRDVSPSNVFVNYDGRVKLLDFGVARVKSRVVQTRTGELKGKLSYMSPEQTVGGQVDHRTDIFALGIVLWELCTGRKLFRRDTDQETLLAVRESAIAPIREVNPHAPPALETIACRALARDPAERYPAAGDMERDLEAFLRQSGGIPSPSRISQLMRKLFTAQIAEEKKLLEAFRATSHDDFPIADRPTTGEHMLPEFTGTPVSVKELTSRTRQEKGTIPSGQAPGPSGPRQRMRRVAIAAGGALGLLAMVLVVRGMASRNAPSEKPTPEAAVPSPSRLGPNEVGPRRASPPPAAVEPPRESTGESDRPHPASPPSPQEPTEVGPSGVTAVAEPKPRAAEPAAARSANGFLTLDAEPWATVLLGRQKLGDTPLIHASVRAGSHELTLVNPELGVEKKIRVTIRQGKVTQIPKVRW